MPTMKELETALRLLGWRPVEPETGIRTRLWFHPEAPFAIRVERTTYVTEDRANAILARAQWRPPFR